MRTLRFPLLALFLALIAAGAAAQTGPALVVAEPVRDAGAVRPGTLVRETFVLRNEGTEDLRIHRVDPDCGCAVAAYDRVIPPGSSGEITAEVDLSSFVGPIAKYLTVLTNDPAKPQVSLTIKADVQPQIQSYPGYARFVTVVGEGAMHSEQTVWASDFDDLRVLRARSPYRFLDVEFREASADEERPEGRGRQWMVTIELAKNARIGPIADHVVLETNHPERKTVRIPVSGFVRPILSVNPPIADFGAREGNAPIVASVHVKNFSEDTIRLLSVTPDNPAIQIEIEPDGDDNYLIITIPVDVGKGPFSSQLTVQTDSSRMPTFEVEVRGEIL
jgi:hypothetical protein